MKLNPNKPDFLEKEVYLLTLTKNSIGTKMFRNFYAIKNGKRTDLLKNGELSCGYFVSFILRYLDLIGVPHLTVEATELDMKKSGWKETDKKTLRPGSIIIWNPESKRTNSHKHIGFYIGSKKAISTDSKKGTVRSHHVTFNGKRRIMSVYWNKKLKDKLVPIYFR